MAQASNLTLRLVSGLVAIPAMLALMYLGPELGWAAFVGLACVIGSVELYGMAHPDDRPSRVVSTLLTLGVFAVVWFWSTEPRALLAVTFLLPIASLNLVLARLGDMDKAALRAMATTFGPLYLGGGLGSLALLRKLPEGPALIVLALVLSWASDTGAYFAGTLFGKRKLFERISPKKSWEGVIGGGLLALAFAYGLPYFFSMIGHEPTIRSWQWMVVGALIVVGGTYGDLIESLLKRSIEIKDSGTSLPGHGGFLDRFDGLLISAPFIVAFLEIF